jgi:hypothetical protein
MLKLLALRVVNYPDLIKNTKFRLETINNCFKLHERCTELTNQC